jgi:squalene synthase HpnC
MRTSKLLRRWTIAAVTIDHYENFPVASFLCPPSIRPAVAAIYRFARTADDLADEGDVAPEARLNELRAYRAELDAICNGESTSKRWPEVFGPLHVALQAHRLPIRLLIDLLSAFEQDVVKQSYADRAELLDYCRRSANPVGRLLLHLYGIDDARSLSQSDSICTALQLANFWQDLGVDTRRSRLYIPMTDCARYGVATEDLLAQRDGPKVHTLVADMVTWAREMMLEGAPLVHTIPGRAGWELRLVVQGGLRILDRIESMDFATLHSRPVLRWNDLALMAGRALMMRARPEAVAGSAA